jgi:acetolactate synthase-1/2/3 large subunit
MMAEASAKLTNKIGVVVTTTGPGGANAFGGMVEAWVDSVPVFLISGQVKRNQMVPDLRSFGIQGFNIIDNVRKITKYAAVVTDARDIRFHLEKAVYMAKEGRPGPVWLDIPLDIQSEVIDSGVLEPFISPVLLETSDDWKIAVEDALKILARAERPLIVVGQGVRLAGAIAEFKALIDNINAPVVSTRMGQDILPDSHPLYFNLGGIRGHKHTGLIMNQCDVILSLGSSMPHTFIGESAEAFSKDVKVIMVDLDRAEIEKPGLKVLIPIVHDIKEVINLMNDLLGEGNGVSYKKWVDKCRYLKTTYPLIRSQDMKNPINSYYFIERLEAASDSHHIFVSDAGSAYFITGQALKFDKGQREITSGAFASMGMALPLAIGAAVTGQSAQILAITGDGSIELNIQELSTISQYGLNIKIFVINNGGYASVRNTQDALCEGRHTNETPILNFKKVADAFGLPYCFLDKYETLDSEISTILKENGPALIELICDNSQEMILPLKVEE